MAPESWWGLTNYLTWNHCRWNNMFFLSHWLEGIAWKMYHLAYFCGSLRPVDWQDRALETEITSCKWGFCLVPHITEAGIHWIKQNNPRVWARGPRENRTENPVGSVCRTTNNFENRWVKSIAALSSWALQISLQWELIYRQRIPARSNWIKPDKTSSTQIQLHRTKQKQFKAVQIRSKWIKLYLVLKLPLQHENKECCW